MVKLYSVNEDKSNIKLLQNLQFIKNLTNIKKIKLNISNLI